MSLIPIAQLGVSILLIALILLQERGSGLSGIFGGGGGENFYQKRRGLEKIIFGGTIVLAAALAVFSLLNLAV